MQRDEPAVELARLRERLGDRYPAVFVILGNDDARFEEAASVRLHSIRSFMCVPLRLRDRTLGTVYVDARRPGRVFRQEDLRFLEALADHFVREDAQALMGGLGAADKRKVDEYLTAVRDIERRIDMHLALVGKVARGGIQDIDRGAHAVAGIAVEVAELRMRA